MMKLKATRVTRKRRKQDHITSQRMNNYLVGKKPRAVPFFQQTPVNSRLNRALYGPQWCLALLRLHHRKDPGVRVELRPSPRSTQVFGSLTVPPWNQARTENTPRIDPSPSLMALDIRFPVGALEVGLPGLPLPTMTLRTGKVTFLERTLQSPPSLQNHPSPQLGLIYLTHQLRGKMSPLRWKTLSLHPS